MRTDPIGDHATPPATLVFMPKAAIKGRGTVWAIEHRFTSERHSAVDDGWGTLEQAAREERAAPQTQIIEQQVRTILSGNESPDISSVPTSVIGERVVDRRPAAVVVA